MCANPRDAPAPRTRATLAVGLPTGGGGVSFQKQPASVMRMRKARTMCRTRFIMHLFNREALLCAITNRLQKGSPLERRKLGSCEVKKLGEAVTVKLASDSPNFKTSQLLSFRVHRVCPRSTALHLLFKHAQMQGARTIILRLSEKGCSKMPGCEASDIPRRAGVLWGVCRAPRDEGTKQIGIFQ